MPEDDGRKVLILYASYGDGHIQVSRSLAERFRERAGFETTETDLFAEAYPRLNELAKLLYIKSYTWFPNLYGFSYYATRNMGHDSLVSRWFQAWGMRKLREVLRRERPLAVVNTFPIQAMPELKRRTGEPIPVFNVLTDYALHRRWVHPYVDRYYVATEDLRDEMVRAGVPPERIEVTGIPLRGGFVRLPRTDALYAKYGISPAKRTVLLTAGSYGVLQGLRNLCRSLAALGNVQLLVVCGRNEKLLASMRELESPDIRVFGFMNAMHELMSLADVMITKPGGITLTEAIQCELPLVLLRPVPGQERDNALYLASRGAALVAYDDNEALAAVTALLDPRGGGGRAVRAMARLKREYSAERIVRDIAERLGCPPDVRTPASDVRRMTSE